MEKDKRVLIIKDEEYERYKRGMSPFAEETAVRNAITFLVLVLALLLFGSIALILMLTIGNVDYRNYIFAKEIDNYYRITVIYCTLYFILQASLIYFRTNKTDIKLIEDSSELRRNLCKKQKDR